MVLQATAGVSASDHPEGNSLAESHEFTLHAAFLAVNGIGLVNLKMQRAFCK